MMEHYNPEVQRAIQNLLDRLCQNERSTGRNSILILRETDFCLRAQDGVQAYIPDDFSDEQVLKLI